MSFISTLSPELILTKLAYKYHWDMVKKNLDLVTLISFSRSHQHFEWQIWTKNSLSAPYLLNQMMDSGQVYVLYQ